MNSINYKENKALYMGGAAERRSDASCYAWLTLSARLSHITAI